MKIRKDMPGRPDVCLPHCRRGELKCMSTCWPRTGRESIPGPGNSTRSDTEGQWLLGHKEIDVLELGRCGAVEVTVQRGKPCLDAAYTQRARAEVILNIGYRHIIVKEAGGLVLSF